MEYQYQYESTRCNICQADDFELISKKGQFGLPVNVGICRNCGLGYLNPRWDKASYSHFYRVDYDKYYRPDIHEQSTRLGSTNPILERLERKRLLPDDVNFILDIGSGEGSNLADFGRRFPSSRLFAIEPSEASQELLRGLNIEIISSDAASQWDKDLQGRFDIIIMRHVLEHFLDPAQILIKARGCLSKDGIVYIAVPNCLNPVNRLEGHWFRVVHTYYFNRFSLKNIMSITGLKVRLITEGDKFNPGEIFLVASAGNVVNQLSPSSGHYTIQRDLFLKRIRKENSPLYRATVPLRRVLRKLLTAGMS